MVRFQSDMHSSCGPQASPASAGRGGRPTRFAVRAPTCAAVAWTEQGGADPDLGAALLDGDLEIVAHPHRADRRGRVRRRASRTRGTRAVPPRCRPRSVRPSSARARPAPRRSPARPAPSTSPTAHPPLPGSPVVSTWISTRPPGCPLGDLVDRRGAVETAPDVDEPASWRTLLRCSRPMKCTSGPAVARSVVALVEQLLGVVLTDGVAAGGHRGVDRLGAETLGDGDHARRGGSTRRSTRVDAGREAPLRPRLATSSVVDHGSSNQTTSAWRSRSATATVRAEPPVAPRARRRPASSSTPSTREPGRDRRRHVERARAPAASTRSHRARRAPTPAPPASRSAAPNS